MSKRILKFSWLVIVCAFVLVLPLRVSAAVTISSFNAKWQSGKVVVNWTAIELNNVGFNILRSTSPTGSFAQVNPTRIPTRCLGCITATPYSFTDSTVTSGQTYYYRVQTINTSNVSETYSVTAIASAAATPAATAVATATRTRTPTVTATNVPGAPTATTAPQYTPTRTATYPPGVTPPSATPTSLRVAAASSPARPGAANSPAAASSGVGTPASTRIALAPPEPTTEDSTEVVENGAENSEEPQNAGDVRGQWLARGGVIVIGGLFGFGALGCSIIAIFLVGRFSRRED